MLFYINWANDLVGVSPVARLLAFRMANNAGYLDSGMSAACQIDLEKTLAWLGCSETELDSAISELRAEGVNPLYINSGNILYTFPVLAEDEDRSSSWRRQDYALSIYVISAAVPGVTKIGISKYPESRLHNLQQGSPMQRLTMPWKFEGVSSVIRRVERRAHLAFEAKAMGREWFQITAEEAISKLKELLSEAATDP